MWLENIKVGDEVLVWYSYHRVKIATVTTVNKKYITLDDGEQFIIGSGKKRGHAQGHSMSNISNAPASIQQFKDDKNNEKLMHLALAAKVRNAIEMMSSEQIAARCSLTDLDQMFTKLQKE